MNKRIVFILVMLAVLIILGIALFLLVREPPEGSSAEEPVKQEFIFTAENPVLVTVSNNHGEYTMRGGNNPSIVGHENLPVNIFYFFQILGAAWGITSHGLVTDEAVDLSIFGLDPPLAQVQIHKGDGSAVTLLVGSTAPDGNVYVKLESSLQIHLASHFEVSSFTLGLLDLMDTALTPLAQRDEYENLVYERIILGGEARREAITIVPAGPEDIGSVSITSNNRIVRPVNAFISIEEMPMLESMFGLYAERAVALVTSDAELAQFGLLRPWSTLEITAEGMEYRMRISKPDDWGYVFIKREEAPIIYEAYSFDLPWLETTWFDLMNKMVILPHIDSIASIDIKTPERTVTFTLSGEGNNLSVRSEGINIDTGIFRVFYQNLVAARYDEYVDVHGGAFAPPFLDIIYHYRDSSRSADIVGFHQATARRVFVSLNRGRPFFTYSDYPEQILSDLELVLSGQRVRSYL